MTRLPVALALLVTSLPIAAQDQSNGLEVRPDPQNVVASSLLGAWKLDAALGQRLGNKSQIERLEFRDDGSVVAKVPAKIAAKLKEHRIYLAGIMVLQGKEQPFLLTELTGNPTVVWFRERGGDPLGDAESFTVMLVRAEAQPADLLFVGGDFDNQSFAAYGRETKVVGTLAPAAALTDMIALLEAGKAREFVEKYCAPADLTEMTKAGRTVEQLAARFEGERKEQLVEALKSASKVPAKMNEAGDEAAWKLDQGPRDLRLQRIDGRWYIRNR